MDENGHFHCGNFEVNVEEGYVRLEIEGTYEYIVSKEKHGDKSTEMALIFRYAFHKGKEDTQYNMKKALGLGKYD